MSLESALALIETAANDRVLFAGESIRDVYRYVTPLGRPSKEVVLSVKQASIESFEGGIRAAARAAESICARVEVWSDRSITKTRYLVENIHVHKLFQVYEDMERLDSAMPIDLQEFDTVAVIDYGHGMMNDDLMVALQDQSPYLAVNVQVNSGNYGFNLATKYDRCDYLVADELEARLATLNQHGPIEQSVEELGTIAGKVIVTVGRHGAIGWTKETGCIRQPTYSAQVVDTIGAGDAFFAVTAPLADEGDIRDLMMIGNAAGALVAGIVGHRKTITKQELIAHLRSIP